MVFFILDILYFTNTQPCSTILKGGKKVFSYDVEAENLIFHFFSGNYNNGVVENGDGGFDSGRSYGGFDGGRGYGGFEGGRGYVGRGQGRGRGRGYRGRGRGYGGGNSQLESGGYNDFGGGAPIQTRGELFYMLQ